MTTRALVVAKSPVPGLAKTRLGADVGMDRAADLAAAALLDTLAACAEAFGVEHCHLALAGDLDGAARAEEVRAVLAGWTVRPQHGDGFAERLVRAHADLAVAGPGVVVQVGMDTPQVTPALLHRAVAALPEDPHAAVLGPAEDGGWWVLALRDAADAAALHRVAMSTPTTYADTRRALEDAGSVVATTTTLRDVDTVADAALVARAAPASRFARAWDAARG